MALTWSVEKVEDYETVCKIVAAYDDPSRDVKVGDTIWNPVTEALIWASLSTGIGTITEANAAEVFGRIRLIEQLFGPLLIRAEVDGVRPEGEKAFITVDEVRSHIGLSTNASFKDEIRSKWLKRQAGYFVDAEVRRYNRNLEAATA